MLTSKTTRSLLALSALALTLSGSVMAAQAATVLSSVHYQKRIVLACAAGAGNENNCQGFLAAPGDKRRLNITRINCALIAPPGSEFSQGGIYLRNPTGINAVVFQYLPVDYSSPSGFHTLNQAVDMQVAATQHVTFFLAIASGGFYGGGSSECTATGTLDTLQ
jgi:hypothetical protein